MTADVTPHIQAAVLRAIAASKNPRLDLPTVAANRELTLTQAENICSRGGYPNRELMRRNAERLINGLPLIDTPPPTSGSANGYVTAVPIDRMFVDHTYQRPIDTHRVAGYVSEYDHTLIGIIEVAERPDGRYAILDGQHRWATAKVAELTLTHLPCRVHRRLTLHEEAALYTRLNTTRRSLTTWDRWKGRRAAGDPAVTEIETTLARHGLAIAETPAPTHVRATKACETVVSIGGPQLLDDTMRTIRGAYPDDVDGLNASIITGVAHVLYHYPTIDTERLTTALARMLPRQLIARAAAAREIQPGSLARLTATVIVDRYNATPGPNIRPFAQQVKPHSKPPRKPVMPRAEANRIRQWATENQLLTGTRLTQTIIAAYRAAHHEKDPQ